MHWDIDTLVPIFATIIYGVAFLMVALSRPLTQARLSFRWYLLAMMIWSLGALLLYLDQQRALFWFRTMSFAAIGSMVALFYFIQMILSRQKQWAIWVFLYGIVSMALSLFTDLVVTSVSVEQGLLSYEFSPFIGIIAGPGYGLTIFSFRELFNGYRASNDANQRNRFRYLMIGLGVIMFASIINFTPLGIYPIDIAANGVTAVLISYAILRHNLLDIKVVFRKGLLYSIPTIVIGTAYFLIISLTLNVFQFYVLVAGSAVEIFLISFSVAILTAILAEPLRGGAQSWIDRLFFREQYDATMMMQRLSGKAASVLNLLDITSMILEEDTSTLHIKNAAFFLKREGRGEFDLTSQIGLSIEAKLRLEENHPLASWFSSHNHVLMNTDLDVLPQFKALWGRERLELNSVEAELFIPVIAKNELVGIFAVGPKLSEQPYSKDDQLTLMTLANQTAVAIENARLFDNEANRRQEAETWGSILSKLTSALDIEQVLESTLIHIREVIPYDRAQVFLLTDSNQQLIVERVCTVTGNNPHAVISEELQANTAIELQHVTHTILRDAGLTEKTVVDPSIPAKIKYLIESSKPSRISDKTSMDAWFKDGFSTGSWIGAPIIVQGNVDACLSLDKDKVDFYQKDHLDTLNIFAGQTALALQNASLFSEVQHLAKTDELTGILNRRNLFESGENEINRARRFDRVLSVIMMDLDNLKQINDGYGHLVGDQALCAVAALFKNTLREIDIFGRYGGDEFVILLPEIDLPKAILIAERLCLVLKENPISVNNKPLQITASFGVAGLDHDTNNLASLINQADIAMYNAKHSGRDQVFANSRGKDINSVHRTDQ